MKPSQHPDSIHLQAAEGWIELGNYVEANEELEQIATEMQAHPKVLELRWQIHANAKKWEAALETASALAQLVPGHPLGWIHRSYCLHELKRTEEARDNLLRVVDKFTSESTVHYNLACYECRLGRLERAKNWLQNAFDLEDARQIKRTALSDPDLEPLWWEIGSW